MFLELVNTDKYLNNLINFGVEGVDYEKVSDNVIKLDVYKRQAQLHKLSGGEGLCLPNQQHKTIVAFAEFQVFHTDAPYSVSYTHLDVYKRQSLR